MSVLSLQPLTHLLGRPCTRHRIFLATLIVATKYLNDSSLRNKQWAEYAQHFDLPEVNLMEGQLLYILGYNLRFDEREACVHFAPFMAARLINPRVLTPIPKEFRAAAVERLQRLSRSRVRTQLPAPLGEIPLSPPTRQFAKPLPSSRLAGTRTHSYV